jgi:predicted 2-oxoglutarate/Fe(II)-dependent dioxygenase YbiX
MRKEELDGNRIYVIHDFFSPKVCDAHIERSEDLGYEEAAITTSYGPIMRKDVRDNERLIIDSHKLAEVTFQQARPFLEPEKHGWELTGFNERMRYYRYDPGQTFRPHYDGSYRRSDDEHSLVTFMIYLNDDFEGGETKFYRDSGMLSVTVKPSRGMALVFDHDQLHEGAPVESGRKYVLRTDVMYARPSH